MTPTQFIAAYLSTAQKVSTGTGIAPVTLLAQWANETGWGTSWAGAPNNLGNIENNGKVVAYPSLDAFAQACIDTFHNGFYNAVLAAQIPIDQLNAIVASPWSAGHYGGSLMSFYQPIFAVIGGAMIFVLRHTSTGAEYMVDAAGKRGISAAVAAALDSAAKAGGQAGLIVVNADAALDQIPDAPTGSGGGTVDLAPVLQAIAALQAVVTRIETGLRSA